MLLEQGDSAGSLTTGQWEMPQQKIIDHKCFLRDLLFSKRQVLWAERLYNLRALFKKNICAIKKIVCIHFKLLKADKYCKSPNKYINIKSAIVNCQEAMICPPLHLWLHTLWMSVFMTKKCNILCRETRKTVFSQISVIQKKKLLSEIL